MLNQSIFNAEKLHLSELLEAVQCCVYFLDASSQKLALPLTEELLKAQKKELVLFAAMAAINERFVKLQDTFAAAMRHACILAGEPSDSFLKVLNFFEKSGVIELFESWQLCRTSRNLAAYSYEIEFAQIADHFNTLKFFTTLLFMIAIRFLFYCHDILGIEPKQVGYSIEFMSIVKNEQVDEIGMIK